MIKIKYMDCWYLLPLLHCFANAIVTPFCHTIFFRAHALTNENFVFPICLVTVESKGHPAAGLSELPLHEVGLGKLIFCQPWWFSCKEKECDCTKSALPKMAAVVVTAWTKQLKCDMFQILQSFHLLKPSFPVAVLRYIPEWKNQTKTYTQHF